VILPEEYRAFLFQKQNFWTAVNKYLLNIQHKDSFKDLINKLLAQTPAERPTIEGIEQQPWYTSVVPFTLGQVEE